MILSSILFLSVLCITTSATPASHYDDDIQHPLSENKIKTVTMNEGESPRQRVPGDNDAYYGPVPKAEQIFEIEFLEIAPSPILV